MDTSSSADEMRRILKSLNHYEALGFSRHKKIDDAVLKREYRKKVWSLVSNSLMQFL